MPPAKNNPGGLTATLEVARRDLLDLGLRNTLLNYRPLRAKGADVISETPPEVFQLLVREEKHLNFLPGELVGHAENGEGQLAQPGDDSGGSTRHKGLRLQTPYSSTQLQNRLLATYHAARTSMEEQGVNTLYLALGMLVWREEDNSDKFYRAPLILIPVELERSNARERFHLKYTGEELGENISLAEKLKQSFGIKTFPPLPEPDDLDVDAYFQKVESCISGQTGWTVDRGAIALGFFSFAKFLMYRDLNPATWPTPDAILSHGILQALLADEGFQASSSNYRDDCSLDDQLQNREILHVVDSDSSQTIAVLDAMDGHDMVIQGPPGTGKSQTIVNLIAGAVAEGKRVLFVSEKMAALDVVKRRLDHVGLGAGCLELHSNRTNKRTIIEELRRTALGERHGAPRSQAELSLLGEAKNRLNDYCKAVNEPIGTSGENPCTAYGKILAAQTALKSVDLPPVQVDGIADWTAEDTIRRTQLVIQLQDRVSRTGIPIRHAFWGSQLTIVLPTDRDEIRKRCTSASAAYVSFEKSAKSIAQRFSTEAPDTQLKADLLLRSAQYVISAPVLDGVNLSSAEWITHEQQIREALVVGKRYRDLHQRYEAILRPEAWRADVSETRNSVADLGRRWWRPLSGRWRNAKKTLAAICTTRAPSGQTAQIELLDAIVESAECVKRTVQATEQMGPLFAKSWKGLESDWDLIESQANWIIEAWKGIHQGTLAPWCVDRARMAIDRNVVSAQISELGIARKAYEESVSAWVACLRVDESRFAEGTLASQPFDTLHSRWLRQNDQVNELHDLVAFNQMSSECNEEGLGSIATVATHWENAGRFLVPLFERLRLSTLLERAFKERNALASFDGIRHGNTVAEFCRLDLLQLQYNRTLLAFKHGQALPPGGGAGEVGILWREFEKRTRFLPIRGLISKAGHAIQSIKPVFMMSPLSIANYLPPGGLAFELVIFDEASQIRPVDGLGAILRGRQVIVVGDSKQLPPTSFFDSLTATDEAESDDEETAASDVESVLGLFCSRGAHQRMLRWHYRSRHESLITVSNHLSYDDRLVVFPSPDKDREKLGLVYRRLENAPYERSRTRTNPVEARVVARAVMEHARSQMQLPPERWDTLGVAAFSVAQMDAILTQVEVQRRQDPSSEPFFSGCPHEPFFVKNLENVQGDERDVIFISIGYGRTAEGYLAMSFGPLNRSGGERRLNVLISRARKRCEVFTSLGADDIDLTRTNSAGVAALKMFLNYAQTGQMDVPTKTDRLPDSEFEDQVFRQLTALGYEVHTQVGSAGFFLDLAVIDPAHPGRYLLGIECDGARYHSARSARDRDRLRQAVLAGLGWRIHRIWSTDWFHSPDQELRKVVQAIEVAQTATPTPQRPPASAEEIEPPETAPLLVATQPTRSPAVARYECAHVRLQLGDLDMHLVSRTQLADLLAQVVKVESPVHWTEAARRVLDGAGVQRFGNRIQQAFEQAVRFGIDRKLFVKKDDFLWAPAMQQSPVRNRSELPAASRKLEFVSPEEIRRAILIVVEESYGIVPADVPGAVCRLFGFARVTDEMSAAVEPHRDALLRDGYLSLQGVNLVSVSLSGGPPAGASIF